MIEIVPVVTFHGLPADLKHCDGCGLNAPMRVTGTGREMCEICGYVL